VVLGYDDTPFIPGSDYRVHDSSRPQPAIVTPGTASTAERAGRAPSDAVVLFDGTDLSGWIGQDGAAARWQVENGYMQVVPGTGDIRSRRHFGDCQLHVEWAAPAVVTGGSQGRGNSGVFLMDAYEIQVLDCFENPTYADGTTAAIYGEYPPLVNACRRPGEWQTYDIIWTAPRFAEGQLVSPAYVTMIHNGVLVHNHRALTGPTTHRAVLAYTAHAPAAPLRLQDHDDLVRYRSVWYRPLSDG
jgi:hypothetical protein